MFIHRCGGSMGPETISVLAFGLMDGPLELWAPGRRAPSYEIAIMAERSADMTSERPGEGSSTRVLESYCMNGGTGIKERMRSFYSTFIGRGVLAFDIGANHGDRVETFLSLGASVVAVEPQPRCLDDLRVKFGQSSDVVIVDAAVDRRAGSAIMHLSNNDMVSSLNTRWISRVRSGGRFDDSA